MWPVSYAGVLAAEQRVRPHVAPTALREYAPLDDAVGHGTRVWVKHENHNPTNSFKVRNGVSLITRLSEDQRRRGVVAASRGNHGQGLAWAGRRLGDHLAGKRVGIILSGGNIDRQTLRQILSG